MSDYTWELYDKANELYDASDKVGVPLHRRCITIQEVWRKAAQISLARGEDVYPISVLEEKVPA